MIKVRLLLLVATALALGLPVGPAQAQLARTWVSSTGNDGNDCNRLTPCRTFQRAHNQTLALGEISVLDPGGYGAVTITKGISIINDGVGEAGVLVSGGFNGITINAGADDRITLRGLTVKGIGFGGGNGIVFNSGGALTIENCTIRNLDGAGVGNGLVFTPLQVGEAALAVTNTVVTDNQTFGIAIASASAGKVRAVLARVGLYNNFRGLDVTSAVGAGTVDVAVIDSIASGNGGTGYSATADAGHAAILVVLQRSAATSNQVGVFASGPAQIIVDRSLITNNQFGWVGQIFSYSNNAVSANTANEGPMPTFTPR